jgi:hypothetical protein
MKAILITLTVCLGFAGFVYFTGDEILRNNWEYSFRKAANKIGLYSDKNLENWRNKYHGEAPGSSIRESH